MPHGFSVITHFGISCGLRYMPIEMYGESRFVHMYVGGHSYHAVYGCTVNRRMAFESYS